ncbi:peroxisome proliferator-activated receptor gamma coactivator-related protein 1 [Thalassophryne amazonica]|uniref:peroxisome proliferator-activated receptor gamma coactivator-related protein 1 n=1 Tax=Thalassophryne amazonica TaxID=390379 RepID=UPI0014709AC7|nr:peroxisome proliferator-activated receptor gamma coactivator-related protein 1 [Thalassophryne amazonica]
MATPWGGGEDTLTACNMDFFPFDTLDEAIGMSPGETLEAIPSCLDSSLVSIFKDTPAVEAKGLDEESEAMLLTALTEMLDNVDEENISPFDTLPDSDLLSGHKGREHSPLQRLLCLSRSPPEKNTLSSTKSQSVGTNLPRIKADVMQRSDGEEEEEEGFPNLSLATQHSSPDDNLLGSEDLSFPLPVTFEQERDVSVSLRDLVRHMHSYCMTVYVDDEEREQLLPEGGILLEVVDQRENGETILAIPDLDLSVPPPLIEVTSKNKQEGLHEVDEGVSDSSEHIVVDDEDPTMSESPVNPPAPVAPLLCSDVKDNTIIKRKMKTPSCRKRKKKCKKLNQPKPVAGKTIQSVSVKTNVQESPIKPEKGSINEKEDKDSLPSVSSAECPSIHKISPCETEIQVGSITTTLSPEADVKVATPVASRPETNALNVSSELHSQPTRLNFLKPEKPPQHLASESEKQVHSSAAPSAVLSATLVASGASSRHTAPLNGVASQTQSHNDIPSAAPSLLEPKSKSLSLEEYRRLREQKKPALVVKQQDYSSKWPSLPELPKELTPIPILPDTAPKDFRCTLAQMAKKEVEEVKPAWQPRGPGAPPTPEALLVPPAYIVAPSSKVSTAASFPKAQQTSEPPKPSLAHNPLSAVSKSVESSPTQQQACATSAGTLMSHSSMPQLSSNPAVRILQAADGTCSSSGDKGRVCEKLYFQLVNLSKSCSKTTTEGVQSLIATVSASLKAAAPQTGPEVAAPISLNNTGKPMTVGTHACAPASPSMELQSVKAVSTLSEAKEKPTVAVEHQRPKSPTQELIEAFTSEIGIKAADLTSLLEQFENTQAKKKHCVPEVYGRAAAVGNSGVELAKEKTAVERLKGLSSCADLTPPATPPHQMWKPLAPLGLLGKTRAAVVSKQSPRKVIQIEARPLPSIRSRPIPTSAAASVSLRLACMDHDYCLPNKEGSNEPDDHWNVKQQNIIANKPIKEPTATTTPPIPVSSASFVHSPTNTVSIKKQELHQTEPLDHRTNGTKTSSVLETPDASPARQEANVPVKERSPRGGPFDRSYRRHAASRTPSPEFTSKEKRRGRQRRRISHNSRSSMSSDSESDSHSSRSSSRSCSPAKKRYRHSRSESSSSSSSWSSSLSSRSTSRSPRRRRRYSYSSSGSWSRSRSWSRSPQRRGYWRRSRRLYSPSYRPGCSYSAKKNTEDVQRRKEKAIEERRVVYVGRIRSTMSQRELEERFSLFGDVEDCTLHFRDHGDNYGFVTYYNSQDAFAAIDNGSKLRKPDELPFELCFGGRRQFCQTSYSDLDSSRDYDPLPSGGKFDALDFDTLLTQAQKNLRR